MNKILITGGAGFIGSNLVASLGEDPDYEISVLDNESLGRFEHIRDMNARFVRGDILDQDVLRESLEGMDAVVHLAADTRVIDSINNPDHNFETNVVGTYHLLNLAREAGIKRVINASTGGAILGEAKVPVHEDLPPRPLAPYGASKLAAEGYCSAFTGAYGLPTVSLRFSNVYGPRSFHKGSVVAHFFKRILRGEELVVYGDGSQVRDFLFTGDLVEGIRSALDSEVTGVYQLGSGVPTSINELIGTIREVVGKTHAVNVSYDSFRKGEIRVTYGDISKARRDLEFNPQTALLDGLSETWSWFLETHH